MKKRNLVVIGTALVATLLFGGCGTQSEGVVAEPTVVDVVEPETVEVEEPAIEENTAPEVENVVDLSDSPLIGRWETDDPDAWGVGSYFPNLPEYLFWVFNADGTGSNNTMHNETREIGWDWIETGTIEVTFPNGSVGTYYYTTPDEDTLTLQWDFGGPEMILERVSN